jgi:hypothetical protein
MALTRIDDIQLYVGLTAEAGDCFVAKDFLDSVGVTNHLYMYADTAAHADLFTALDSWRMPGAPANITKFPFLIYTEIHSDLPPSQYPRVCVYGADAIAASGIAAKFALGR